MHPARMKKSSPSTRQGSLTPDWHGLVDGGERLASLLCLGFNTKSFRFAERRQARPRSARWTDPSLLERGSPHDAARAIHQATLVALPDGPSPLSAVTCVRQLENCPVGIIVSGTMGSLGVEARRVSWRFPLWRGQPPWPLDNVFGSNVSGNPAKSM